ncbi:Cof-type HAD-IIB family hydrolase [Enterococcus sp. LJL99]
MKKIEAVTFFDLDGTLLDHQSQITPEVKKAIDSLKENNILPVIATGRTLIEVEAIMEASGIDSAIVMNGQFIQVNGEKLYSNEFSYEECKKMHDFAKSHGHELSFYNEKKIWCTAINQTVIDCYGFIHSDLPSTDMSLLGKEPVNMLLVVSEEGDEHYLEHFPELTFYRNGPYSIDVVRKNVSKGSGVKILLDSLGIADVPTFAFGDGLNDIALFEACEHKIAMENARDQLKELATFITKKNTDGGIVHALKHHQLI